MSEVAVQRYQFQYKCLRYNQYRSSRAQHNPIVIKKPDVAPRMISMEEMLQKWNEQARLAIERGGGTRRMDFDDEPEQERTVVVSEEVLSEMHRVRELRSGRDLDLSVLREICAQLETLQAEQQAREEARLKKKMRWRKWRKLLFRSVGC